MNVGTQPSGSVTPGAAARGGGRVGVGCRPPPRDTDTEGPVGASGRGAVVGGGCLSGKHLGGFEQGCRFSKQYFHLQLSRRDFLLCALRFPGERQDLGLFVFLIT